jgi:LAO/AO transport system kinase
VSTTTDDRPGEGRAAADAAAAELLEAAVAGDRSALARLLSMVERGGTDARAAARAAAGRPDPDGYTVGITGAPGAGKSTLTGALVASMRADGVVVGVLAVDPSSPFTGGAILGDRVRMSEHALDDGVFIRSMATRGHLGGLGVATPGAVRVLHAAGRPWVIVETVGVGQVEVEIAGAADTTVVVVNPGWGDAVQANKAGLLEIADVFVINKADRPSADDTRRDLEAMLDLAQERSWRPPIVATVATEGTGSDELWAAIGRHREHIAADGELARRRADRARDELGRVVAERLRIQAQALRQGSDFHDIEQQVVDGGLDPWSAADRLLGEENP